MKREAKQKPESTQINIFIGKILWVEHYTYEVIHIILFISNPVNYYKLLITYQA